MKKYTLLTILFTLSFLLGYLSNHYLPTDNIKKPNNTTEAVKKDKSLNVYAIKNLQSTEIQKGSLTIYEEGIDKEKFTSKIFKFTFSPNPSLSQTKTISGLVNIPKPDNQNKKYPLILMIRGFVDQKVYTTGMGTQKAGEYFASNNLITVAPDFLGYGESDKESGDIFESRFQTYTTVLSLFKSLDQIESWDGKNIGIWAHSNGGHIALTILEISKINYPTVLWAPVSKPFPYSILYYTNESEDKGKYIRKELAKFEETYDTDAFSLDNYFPDIAAHLQIHQGTADDAVPVEWSKNLYNILRKSYKDQKFNYDLDLFVYPGADHNLQPVWESATARSLSFFKKHLTIKPV